MRHTILLSTTGVAQIDQSMRAIIEHMERHFPGRVCGYYLVGSYAYGEAIPNSDIDMIVLFKGSPSDDERQQFEQAREECRQLSARPIDLTAGSEASFMRVGGVWFQTASRLLYGEDIRAAVPRKPVADHTRHLMHSIYPLLARVRNSPPRLAVPLDYPDPAGEFYGYDRRRIRTADGEIRASTKNLVLNVVGAASALTLLAAGQYTGSGKKSEVAEQYRVWVGDEWAAVVETIYQQCRERWFYLVPEDAADRQHLRMLCQQCLGFENHFLERYKAYLLAELAHTDEAIRLFAARRLGQLIYHDAAVVAALQVAGERGPAELRQAIAETLDWYSEANHPSTHEAHT
jgi:predicted nucleotidyltransferase